MGRLGCVDIENFCVFGLECDKSSSPLKKKQRGEHDTDIFLKDNMITSQH
jgi:hypothetical protein